MERQRRRRPHEDALAWLLLREASCLEQVEPNRKLGLITYGEHVPEVHAIAASKLALRTRPMQAVQQNPFGPGEVGVLRLTAEMIDVGLREVASLRLRKP